MRAYHIWYYGNITLDYLALTILVCPARDGECAHGNLARAAHFALLIVRGKPIWTEIGIFFSSSDILPLEMKNRSSMRRGAVDRQELSVPAGPRPVCLDRVYWPMASNRCGVTLGLYF